METFTYPPASDDTHKDNMYGWISPEGEFFPNDRFGTHYATGSLWLMAHPDKRIKGTDEYGNLFKLKFHRLVPIGKIIYVDNPLHPLLTSIQRRKLIDLAIFNDMNEISLDGSNGSKRIWSRD